MKILVTGAGPSGFLGHHVREEFSDLYCTYVGSKDCDLTDYMQTWRLVLDEEPDVILHMAAVCGGILANKNSPGDFIAKNTAMSLNIYNVVKNMYKCKKDFVQYIYTLGSVCSYPKHCQVPFKEDDLWNGYPEETNAPYGIAKRHLYMMGKTYREQYGIKGAHLIPVNMMGSHDHFDLTNSHVIPALINKFVNARNNNLPEVPVWGTGEATREFLHARDCAQALKMAVTQCLDYELPINIGTGRDISIIELARLIKKLTGYMGEIKLTGDVSDGQPKRMLDVSRAKEVLGFEAKISLEDGLKETIAWYEQTQK
jgi:GDP-L-fucose synthase